MAQYYPSTMLPPPPPPPMARPVAIIRSTGKLLLNYVVTYNIVQNNYVYIYYILNRNIRIMWTLSPINKIKTMASNNWIISQNNAR